ncbi:MAG: hypothetical protein EB103_06190 [Actinobacteria bacterium]|nr:hypothetical protein [Actinomycetota bacterium]
MTSVFTILVVVLIVGLGLRIVRDIGLQFPTSYTLLKSSPRIDRRERWAILGIILLAVVFILLLLTAVL